MHPIRTLFAAAVLAAAVTPAGAAIQNNVHKTFAVAPGGTITLEADLGDIQVQSGGTGGVTVDVERTANTLSQKKLSFDQSQNDVHVKAKFDRLMNFNFFNWHNELNLRFVIIVPSHYNLQLSTAGGDVKIGALEGTVQCRTSGGDITIANISGPVNAHTSGGDIILTGASGKVDLKSSGGDIQIGNAASAVDANTSGGSITVRHAGAALVAHTSGGGIQIDEALGTVDAHTSGGTIKARFAQQPRADSELTTSGGDVIVSLANNVAVEVDAHTSGGEVVSDLPVTVMGKQTESSLRGKINGGGPKLTLRSSGGEVRLRKI